ncbi:hypothetical protein BDV96DRAFT_684030 [Lophiotrema nucula]|uniref:Uncharacterized protein n=1 Tax=Lophiotrema nucula TaxID=690887 RepID=A0A6A5ZMG9_9PLEO|nr:hypothetical protein BDV96DRAFT_684030 [Lophiotrema nucula]
MKTTFAAVALLFGAAIAAPASTKSSQDGTQIKVSVINDQSSRNADATVAADGVANPIRDLFAKTAVDANGRIIASSAQLIQFVDNVTCCFSKNGQLIPITGRLTFADLDGNKGVAIPVDITDFTFECRIGQA